MKTLDEVVTVMDHVEFCCTNCKLQFDCDEVECFLEDALHYLKEFQGLSKMWNDKLDKEQDNPPLTWDELQQMEGKPVWVEYIKGGKRVDAEWIVIKKVKSTCIENTSGRFQADSLGWTWQAYRKERS